MPKNSAEPILRFKEVSKTFEHKQVIKNVSFKVYPGESFGIIGLSGSGKTTLFRLILGYYKPTSGVILYNGKNIKSQMNILRKNVGYTTQEDSFYEKLTTYENMRYYAGLYDIHPKASSIKEHINNILTQVKLFKHKDAMAVNLSGGMKHRLNFAISLLHDPDILVMDEPTTGLDPILTNEFWELIDAFKILGKTIIITSHIFDEIEHNCDRVIVLHQGEVQATLNMHQLRGHIYKYFKKIVQK